jgi:hypothetical protein
MTIAAIRVDACVSIATSAPRKADLPVGLGGIASIFFLYIYAAQYVSISYPCFTQSHGVDRCAGQRKRLSVRKLDAPNPEGF